MNLIVAVDQNWGIGYKGDLLERISEDLKFFKKTTTGNAIIMGRVTFDSLPNKKPLPNRTNIVLTKNTNLKIDGCIICNSIDEILKLEDKENVFVIGGADIYKQLLPYCKKAYVTKILNTYEYDRSFINLDNDKAWHLTHESEILKNKNNVPFKFTTYEKLI